ncbi:hypothetical protein HOY80DRAFT_1087648 [Tuber brumale]|nr:hypothetical protein HOY80DRAFT_1087648 [Tuber brumale]
MLMGFEAIAYARSTIPEDYIQDVGKAFQSPPTNNAGGFANPPYRKGARHYNRPVNEPRTMPLFSSGPTDDTNRKDYYRFSRRYEFPGYLERLMDESSKKKKRTMRISSIHMSPSVVASTAALTRRTQINPTIDGFGITAFDGEPDTPIRSPYTM